VNAGQKGNDANQIRDQQVVGSLDTRLGKINSSRLSQPFPHHLRDLEHDLESRSLGTRAGLALDCADAVVKPTVAGASVVCTRLPSSCRMPESPITVSPCLSNRITAPPSVSRTPRNSGTSAPSDRFLGKLAARERTERRPAERPSASRKPRPSMPASEVTSTLQASGVVKVTV
jgi:hypothetical protein